MKKTGQPVSATPDPHAHELCNCPLLCPQQQTDSAASLPMASDLYETLRATLADQLALTFPCSVLVCHTAQFEPLSLASTLPSHVQRVRYHAPATFLTQMLHIVRRTLRTSDQILLAHDGNGAAILLAGVEHEAATAITRRTLQGMRLLQAETVVPPLLYETEILLGLGTLSGPSGALAQFFEQVSHVRERLTFRPAVPTQSELAPTTCEVPALQGAEPGQTAASSHETPFIQLPSRLPARLQQLLPHALAVELRCAPVGRDHQRLVVAMANPQDAHAIDRLRQATGMHICPVSCETAALETLLASGW